MTIKKSDVVKQILGDRTNQTPAKTAASAFASSNIALCKYWGKRNQELNLPVTSSFSISLDGKGTSTEIQIANTSHDIILLNNETVSIDSVFYKRLQQFLNLFRTSPDIFFYIKTQSTIPTSAGFASSASGFAALTLALNELFQWQLEKNELSILARLGSGSACRSIWSGFVEWHSGTREDGMDSLGTPFTVAWPELCLGLIFICDKQKKLSSRDAMQHTITSSVFYEIWPTKVANDLSAIKNSILEKNFFSFGKISESNSLAMHAMMLAAWPPINYSSPETISVIQKIWQLREKGLSVFFTQDAGPNLTLLFLQQDIETISQYFSDLEIIRPFANK